MKIGKKIVRGTGYCMGVPSYQKGAKVEFRADLNDSFGEPSPFPLIQKPEEDFSLISDVRAGSIAGIEEEFANGSYHRDEQKVADKVIAGHFKHPC